LNITYGSNNITIRAALENSADTVWLSADGGEGQNYETNTSEINASLPGLSDGAHNVRVYANNSIGAINYSEAYFTIDTIPPEITVRSPENVTYNRSWVSANVFLDEPGASCSYSLNDVVNITMQTESRYHGLRIFPGYQKVQTA